MAECIAETVTPSLTEETDGGAVASGGVTAGFWQDTPGALALYGWERNSSEETNAKCRAYGASSPNFSLKAERQDHKTTSSAELLANAIDIDSPSVVVLNFPKTFRSSEAIAVTFTAT